MALNIQLTDDEGGVAHKDEVGMIVGHMGELAIVHMDHGETFMGEPRMVTCGEQLLRLVRVAHPGSKGRSRPRR